MHPVQFTLAQSEDVMPIDALFELNMLQKNASSPFFFVFFCRYVMKYQLAEIYTNEVPNGATHALTSF